MRRSARTRQEQWARFLLGGALGLTLLSGMTACGDEPSSTAQTPSAGSVDGPTGAATGPDAPAGGSGTITVVADGKRYEFITDDCSIIQVPAKIFSLSTEDASIEMSLPYDPGKFDQDSDGVIVPLTLGGDDETYQTLALTGERNEAGNATTGTLKGTAKRATTGAEVEFTINFSCPLTRD
ncbi:hypothetical protein AB0J90_19430 [Micromonospora sp. NPDC049523]|uniref:hypothetical protein n=1 Tax=Micromonospora sp. NPDC049523 TaxID=3155921 RepID=UPI003434836C